jgi:vacuolar-type H+-ATPase subunit I/STV1
MSSKNKPATPQVVQTPPKAPATNPNPESTLRGLLEEQGMDVIGKMILIEMDKRMPDLTHKIHLSIQKDLDQLYYSGIENKIESFVRHEVESRVTRVVPDIKTNVIQAIQRQPANLDVHQESREKKRRLNEEEAANNKHLEEQLNKFSETLQMVLNQNKEMQKRINQLESELKKNQAATSPGEHVPDTKHVPPPMSTNLNAKVVAQVEKQVDAMQIDKPVSSTSQQASSKNRKKK